MMHHPGMKMHRHMLLGTVSRQALSFDQVTRPQRVVMPKAAGQGSTEQQFQELLSTVARAKPLATVPCDIRFADQAAANRYRASIHAPLLPEPAETAEPVEAATAGRQEAEVEE